MTGIVLIGAVIDQVLALLPKIGVGAQEAKSLYDMLRDIFGHDVLADKSTDEIAQMSVDGFAGLKAHIAELRAKLEAEQAPPADPPVEPPTEG